MSIDKTDTEALCGDRFERIDGSLTSMLADAFYPVGRFYKTVLDLMKDGF